MLIIGKIKDKNMITIDPNLRDYSKSAYFEQKDKEALAFLKKHGLPKNAGKKGK